MENKFFFAALQPLPSRQISRIIERKDNSFIEKNPYPSHNPSFSAQNLRHIEFSLPLHAATLSQPDPPTQTRPNQSAKKVQPMTTRSHTNRLKPHQFLTTT